MGVAPVQPGQRVRPGWFYTVSETARILYVTRPTVYAMIRRGELTRVHTLRGPKILGSSIIELVQRQGRRAEGK